MRKILNLLGIILPILLLLILVIGLNACKNNSTSIYQGQPESPIFQLFPTDNIWTFIKLDTRNGRMWQVQYDVQGDNRMEVILNENSLVENTQDKRNRFTLYPTRNMYTFILLDQLNGKMWQIQWAIDEENRFIIPISQP